MDVLLLICKYIENWFAASNDREAGDGMTNSGSHLQVDPPVEAAAGKLVMMCLV